MQIAICEDHPLLRYSLKRMLEAMPDMVVTGEFDSVRALAAGVGDWQPDIVIFDLSMQDSLGPESISALIGEFPAMKLLVYSGQLDKDFAMPCLRAGAKGYVMKTEPIRTIYAAITRVLEGGVWLPDGLGPIQGFSQEASNPAMVSQETGLTERELQVFRLIGQGYSNTEIALELGISIKTAEAHGANLRRKNNFSTASELFRLAVNQAEQRDLA